MQLSIVNSFKISSPLLNHARNVTSQCGEDGIIEYIFSTIRPSNRYCVEFGAWDGKHLSNCYNLLMNADWEGVMIEANATKFAELIRTYHDKPNVKTINRFVAFIGNNTLDNILHECGAPQGYWPRINRHRWK